MSEKIEEVGLNASDLTWMHKTVKKVGEDLDFLLHLCKVFLMQEHCELPFPEVCKTERLGTNDTYSRKDYPLKGCGERDRCQKYTEIPEA